MLADSNRSLPASRIRAYSAVTMSETLDCPDCGHHNPAGSTYCERCHFPLVEGAPGPGPADRPVDAPEETPAGPAPLAGDVSPEIPRFRPVRPRRPRPQSNVALSLWLGVGAFLALLLVLIAVQANLERNSPKVEGSNGEQQKAADAFRAELEKDSTDTRARVGLADILFDTGNWSEAIIHYRSAVRTDSSLITAIVDQGVCYYNLGESGEAERLFRLALARDPNQPFALFNLGIVHERNGDAKGALKYFHLALQASPPENMKPAVMEALQRVAKASGRVAPPLDQAK